MKRQSGFTLIELVVVIVILGILAVTAAPRFLNLQSEARASALQGMVGAMQGAAGVVYAKSALEGEEGLASTSSPAPAIAEGVTTNYGYPTANAAGIVAAVTGLEDNAQWEYFVGTSTLLVGLTGQVNAATSGSATQTEITATNCYITYTQASSSSGVTTPPTAVITEDSGC